MKLKLTGIILASTLMMNLSCLAAEDPGSVTTATLDQSEAETLVWMREEEKLARDTYITLYGGWGIKVFDNISRSEQKHMDSMRVLLNTYGIADPVIDNTVGVFADPVLAGLYDELVAKGSTSSLDAFYVGGFIEELDIQDLRDAIEESTHADVIAAYESLLAGSYKHLVAFVGQIERTGIKYQAQYLSQAEVDAILGRETMTAEMADGSWMVTGHNGEGMIFDITINNQFILYWFTYDDLGNQMWLVGLSDLTSASEVTMTLNRYHGPVFGPGFISEDRIEETWGEININFSNCSSAHVNHQSDTGFDTGELDIERIYYVAGALCQAE